MKMVPAVQPFSPSQPRRRSHGAFIVACSDVIVAAAFYSAIHPPLFVRIIIHATHIAEGWPMYSTGQPPLHVYSPLGAASGLSKAEQLTQLLKPQV